MESIYGITSLYLLTITLRLHVKTGGNTAKPHPFMADNVKIYDGSHRQDNFTGQRRHNLVRFKKGRRAGDAVKGVFLGLEAAAPGTAWINLEGESLLAELPPELAKTAKLIAAGKGVGATPTGITEKHFPLRHGDQCWFVLEQLEPEPILRMLYLRPDADIFQVEHELAKARTKVAWQELMRQPPAQTAARYTQSRNRLDMLLQQQLWAKHDKSVFTFPPERLNNPRRLDAARNATPDFGNLRHFLNHTPAASAALKELTLYRAALLSLLKPYGLISLYHLPWLNPALKGIELALYSIKSASYFTLLAQLPDGSHLEFQGETAENSLISKKILPPGSADLPVFLLTLCPPALLHSFSAQA